jgi:two-component system phosphate regulon response regulator PhoB
MHVLCNAPEIDISRMLQRFFLGCNSRILRSNVQSPAMGQPRALVIDDARDTARLVEFHLQRAGFEVQTAATGAEGLQRAAAWLPRVVMLDVRLPDIDGFEVCAPLRANAATEASGVLMLTAHGLAEDRIKAFQLGADDYLTKPFSIRELILRATALARRVPGPAVPGAPPVQRPTRCGEIELDPRTLEVRVSGTRVDLRPAELRLLQVFLENPGAVFSRKALLRRVWGKTGPTNQRVVDVTMHRLRSALGEHAEAIETILAGGYRLRKASSTRE